MAKALVIVDRGVVFPGAGEPTFDVCPTNMFDVCPPSFTASVQGVVAVHTPSGVTWASSCSQVINLGGTPGNASWVAGDDICPGDGIVPGFPIWEDGFGIQCEDDFGQASPVWRFAYTSLARGLFGSAVIVTVRSIVPLTTNCPPSGSYPVTDFVASPSADFTLGGAPTLMLA